MPNSIPDITAPTSADLDAIFNAILLLAESQVEFGWTIANRIKVQNQILAHMAGINIEEISNQVTTSPDEKTGD